MRAADLANATLFALRRRGDPFYGPELKLDETPESFPVVMVWDNEWQMQIFIVCCDDAQQAAAASTYGQVLADQEEFEISVQVMWPHRGHEDDAD